MINIHRSVQGFDTSVRLHTLIYCYPFSLVEIVYNSGTGKKTAFARVGFDKEGRRIIKTKQALPKKVHEVINKHFFNCDIFITKNRRNASI